jgi:hypothetical protein
MAAKSRLVAGAVANISLFLVRNKISAHHALGLEGEKNSACFFP